MRRLEELYYPKAKKEREWWKANRVEKKPLPPGEKTDFTGEPVKVYDRKNMGAKAGKDVAGEVCEDEQLDELSKKTLGKYVKTAALDYGMASTDIARETAITGKQWTNNKKLGEKPFNRTQGIERAVSRLVKGNKRAIKEDTGE